METKKLSEEFNEFMSSPEFIPPHAIRERVFNQIYRELNPSIPTVFLKMLSVHCFVSLFSLSICSQFGVQFLNVYDAMESMMALLGHSYCMIFCGLLYLSVSALALGLFLKPEEIKVIRRNPLLQFSMLAGISLGVFLCIGAEVLFIPGALWIAGSLVGGIAGLELGWMVRFQLKRYLSQMATGERI